MLCALATNAPPDGVTNAEASAMAAARTAVVASVLDETIFPQKNVGGRTDARDSTHMAFRGGSFLSTYKFDNMTVTLMN